MDDRSGSRDIIGNKNTASAIFATKARLRKQKNSVIFGLFLKEQKSRLTDAQRRQGISKPISK